MRGPAQNVCLERGGSDRGRLCPVPSAVRAAGRGQGHRQPPVVPMEPCPSSSSQFSFNIPVHRPSAPLHPPNHRPRAPLGPPHPNSAPRAQPQGAPPAPLPSPGLVFGSVRGVLAAAPGTGGTGGAWGDKRGGLEGGRVAFGPGFAGRASVWQCRLFPSLGGTLGDTGAPRGGGWGPPSTPPEEPERSWVAKSRARHIPGGKGGHKAQRPPQSSQISPPG